MWTEGKVLENLSDFEQSRVTVIPTKIQILLFLILIIFSIVLNSYNENYTEISHVFNAFINSFSRAIVNSNFRWSEKPRTKKLDATLLFRQVLEYFVFLSLNWCGTPSLTAFPRRRTSGVRLVAALVAISASVWRCRRCHVYMSCVLCICPVSLASAPAVAAVLHINRLK